MAVYFANNSIIFIGQAGTLIVYPNTNGYRNLAVCTGLFSVLQNELFFLAIVWLRKQKDQSAC